MSIDSVMKIRSKETHEKFIISINDTLNGRVLEHIIVLNTEPNYRVEFPLIDRVLTF